MKLSLTGVAFKNLQRTAGYGEASYNIYETFKKLGLDVGIELPKANIELCFTDPANIRFLDPNSYKICYVAWESTDMTKEAKAILNKADEIWATSPWTAEVYKKIFPDKKIFVYKHGINEMWKPKLREKAHKPFTFLHIGEPFSRKDGQLVVDCFTELFGKDENYRLVLKCSGINTTRVWNEKYNTLSSPSAEYKNILEITPPLTTDQMVGLYDLCDVFVYPSWGEGFGFQPLQALASGMPVISTSAWSDYKKYINYEIDYSIVRSPWQKVHQGDMMKPDKNHLKHLMLKSVVEYESLLKETYKNAFIIHEEYDWVKVSEPAVKRLQEIYKNL